MRCLQFGGFVTTFESDIWIIDEHITTNRILYIIIIYCINHVLMLGGRIVCVHSWAPRGRGLSGMDIWMWVSVHLGLLGSGLGRACVSGCVSTGLISLLCVVIVVISHQSLIHRLLLYYKFICLYIYIIINLHFELIMFCLSLIVCVCLSS